MLMVMKAVVSSLFIVGINAIAQRNASLAGWIASLPLVTLLSIGWLSFDQRGDTQIAQFLTGVLWGLILTSLLLAVTTALLARHVALVVAAAAGVAAWITCFFAAKHLGAAGV